MPRLLRSASLVAIALGVATTAAWLLRRPLSEAVVARWFAGEGIPARYRITALSNDAVTLDDVSIGPASAPDFRARRVELRFGWSVLRPRVAAITLVGPTLHASIGPSGLSLGTLDRLLPSPGGPAAPLPDLNVTLVDAHASLATPAGTIVITGDGKGRLRGGFAGRFIAGDTRLAASGCAGHLAGATLDVSTTRADIRVTGEGNEAGVDCGGNVSAVGIRWRAGVRLPPMLDRYLIDLTARTGRARANGVAAAAIDLTADGAAETLGGPVAGGFRVAATNASLPGGGAAVVGGTGRYRLDRTGGTASLDARVTVSRGRLALPVQPLRATAARASNTLAAPLALALAHRLDAAARRFDARATLELTRRDGVTTASITDTAITAATGARLTQTGRMTLTDARITLDGGVALAGGGLPTTTLAGRGSWQDRQAVGSGAVTLARWTVQGAAVEASRLAFTATPDSVALAGAVGVSGSLGAGIAADRLVVPVDARFDRDGTVGVGERCLPVAWSGIVRADAHLAAGSVTFCPVGGPMLTVSGAQLRGEFTVAPATLAGRVETDAVALTAGRLRISVSGTRSRPTITVAPVALAGQFGVRRGRATVGGTLDVARSSARGTLAGMALDDRGIPVAIDDGAATWLAVGERIDLSAATVRIVDRTAPARFQPLRVTAGTASVADGVIRADGDVRVAANRARLAHVTARHELASASGSTAIDTGPLVFGPALQPTDITEALRGVVANVRGPVTGTGIIDWSATGLTSRGTLRIDGVALATEALGPIDGIAGTIVFDDLFALTTPPGQTLRIARINPGVVVDDGVAVFRMLGPDAAAIDSIRWPYAGGTLALAPVTVRQGDTRRDFLLAVDGIDAQLFLQRFEIKNLNVTGRFDGTLPLVFADGHGRIVGGRLVAREGGGLVQYVGEIGAAQTGAAARLAFDALRRLRYRDLALDLDGDLDGELVTQVRFAGSNEAAATIGGGPLPIKVTGLPFRFGITVRAPFRALLGTAASFSDVRPLLRATPPASPVQPK